MKPALSIILFTTMAGAAQGMAVVVALTSVAGMGPQNGKPAMIWLSFGMILIALFASFFHLGHPLRAWRAALMWRTSWMSREVILLPVFAALLAAWAISPTPIASAWLGGLVVAGAFLLWFCTAMIYACIRFIQEWAHPLTLINYTLMGLASGAVLSGAVAILRNDLEFAALLLPWAIALTSLAWMTRGLSLRRNSRLKPRSTLQSATGIRSSRVVQKSMGMTGGSFNTREFFHGVGLSALRWIRLAFQILAFAVPILLMALSLMLEWTSAWLAIFPVQLLGLMIERWFFFAQANHPQNLYYQVVS